MKNIILYGKNDGMCLIYALLQSFPHCVFKYHIIQFPEKEFQISTNRRRSHVLPHTSQKLFHRAIDLILRVFHYCISDLACCVGRQMHRNDPFPSNTSRLNTYSLPNVCKIRVNTSSGWMLDTIFPTRLTTTSLNVLNRR